MPIRESNPEIPEWLSTMIRRLMAKKKIDRYQSAQDVHDILESCLSHIQQPAANPLPRNLTESQQPRFSARTTVMIGVFSMLTIATVISLLYTPWTETGLSKPGSVTASDAKFADSTVQNSSKDSRDLQTRDRKDKQAGRDPRDDSPIDQIARMLEEWKKRPLESAVPDKFAEDIHTLHTNLYKGRSNWQNSAGPTFLKKYQRPWPSRSSI